MASVNWNVFLHTSQVHVFYAGRLDLKNQIKTRRRRRCRWRSCCGRFMAFRETLGTCLVRLGSGLCFPSVSVCCSRYYYYYFSIPISMCRRRWWQLALNNDDKAPVTRLRSESESKSIHPSIPFPQLALIIDLSSVFFFCILLFFFLHLFLGLCRTGKREIVTDTQNGQQHRKCISGSHADTFWSARFTISDRVSDIVMCWCSDVLMVWCCCHQFNNKSEARRTHQNPNKKKNIHRVLIPNVLIICLSPPTQPSVRWSPRLPLSQATVRKILFRSSGFWFNTKNTQPTSSNISRSLEDWKIF